MFNCLRLHYFVRLHVIVGLHFAVGLYSLFGTIFTRRRLRGLPTTGRAGRDGGLAQGGLPQMFLRAINVQFRTKFSAGLLPPLRQTAQLCVRVFVESVVFVIFTSLSDCTNFQVELQGFASLRLCAKYLSQRRRDAKKLVY